MDWNWIVDDWASFKPRIALHWSKLNAERLDAVAGVREELVAALQATYDTSRQEAE